MRDSNGGNLRCTVVHAKQPVKSQEKSMRGIDRGRRVAITTILTVAALLAWVLPSSAFAASHTVKCDASINTVFRSDANITVLSVNKVKKGDPYPNPTTEQGLLPKIRPATFIANLCWVKLLVGPGVPGPAGVPSTSRGIGIEVWLPEKAAWNHRFHALGGAGWANGTQETILGKINSVSGIDTAAPRWAGEGEATSTTDNGQQFHGQQWPGGSFAMMPDGSLNYAGLRDWSYRGLYEQAVVTKELIEAYYGSPPTYSYFTGGSGGGRQALDVAQYLPEQYNGILAEVPGVSFTSFIAEAYPLLILYRDLDGKEPSRAQLETIGEAAVAACDRVGGKHLGFIIDNHHCRYDPTKDRSILCPADGGTNQSPACVSRKLALAMNKIWYGLTVDGSVPDPAVDNGWDTPLTGKHIWHGYPRGGAILSLQDPMTWLGGPGVGEDVIALALHDPKLASSDFTNAISNGENGWKNLSYEELAGAYEALMAIQTDTGLNPNDPDLTRLRDSGTKLIHIAHLDDSSVWVQGHTDYYDSVVEKMGGLESVESYYRLFVLPGLFHGGVSGSANPKADPPMPARGQMYQALVNWVEKGIPPDHLVITSPAPRDVWAYAHYPPVDGPKVSLPVCSYPAVATYVSGDIHQASSYQCE
jgi:feruloyl esterase